MKNRRGFTLIEILIAVVIIAVLATIATVSLGGSKERAQRANTKANINQFLTAAELFYETQGYYPNDDDKAPLISLANGKSFTDGWGMTMDWDNWCKSGNGRSTVYRNDAICSVDKDNDPGPIGIRSTGPDKSYGNADDIRYGRRQYPSQHWED